MNRYILRDEQRQRVVGNRVLRSTVGAHGRIVVKALYCKPEGSWFETR
jgi:hypothetical protein